MKRRLAIITTHPIQYYAPLFRLLNDKHLMFTIKVFYTLNQPCDKTYDPDFGISLKWDIPLLEGYEYTFVNNISDKPGTRRFKGIINPTLTSEIEEWKAEAVLVIGWSFSSHLKAMRFFHKKISVFFKGDSNLLDELPGFSVKKILRRMFLRWVYSYTDYVLYSGKANKQYLAANNVKEDQLIFSPNAVDNERFSGKSEEYEQRAADWRCKLGINQNECVFLFSAKLIKKKDPEILIKAFININHKNTVLIIAGSGKLETELKSKYKNEAKVIFIPFQNQSVMPVVYRLANVFVLPSLGPGETWGLAVNEAMACSRAVIVSDKCGCAPDLVNSNKNGSVFISGNVQSLQNAMKFTMNDSKKMGDCSLAIIQNWNYSVTVNQLNNWFKK